MSGVASFYSYLDNAFVYDGLLPVVCSSYNQECRFSSGTVESVDRFYRCCWALLCLNPVDSQEHFSES